MKTPWKLGNWFWRNSILSDCKNMKNKEIICFVWLHLSINICNFQLIFLDCIKVVIKSNKRYSFWVPLFNLVRILFQVVESTIIIIVLYHFISEIYYWTMLVNWKYITPDAQKAIINARTNTINLSLSLFCKWCQCNACVHSQILITSGTQQPVYFRVLHPVILNSWRTLAVCMVSEVLCVVTCCSVLW